MPGFFFRGPASSEIGAIGIFLHLHENSVNCLLNAPGSIQPPFSSLLIFLLTRGSLLINGNYVIWCFETSKNRFVNFTRPLAYCAANVLPSSGPLHFERMSIVYVDRKRFLKRRTFEDEFLLLEMPLKCHRMGLLCSPRFDIRKLVPVGFVLLPILAFHIFQIRIFLCNMSLIYFFSS